MEYKFLGSRIGSLAGRIMGNARYHYSLIGDHVAGRSLDLQYLCRILDPHPKIVQILGTQHDATLLY